MKLKYSYLLLVTGALFIGLGIWVIATPIAAFLTLARLVCIGLVLAGLAEVFHTLSNRRNLKNWGWFLAGGVITLVLGLHLLLRPEISALILCFYLGFWLLFRSVLHIATGIELHGQGKKWIIFLGIIGLVFSLILLWNPEVISVAVSYWMNFGLIAFGAVQIIVCLLIQRIRKQFGRAREEGYAEVV